MEVEVVNPNPAFAAPEFQARLGKTRAAMAEAGIDVLFCTDPSNMAWLAGCDGWSFYVYQGVLIGPDGDPVWWGRGMDRAGALRSAVTVTMMPMSRTPQSTRWKTRRA